MREALYVAVSRARKRVVLAYPRAGDRGAAAGAVAAASKSCARELGAEWEDSEEELFGPAETLHSTYRLLRDELLEGTMRAGGRLASCASTPTSTSRTPSSATSSCSRWRR